MGIWTGIKAIAQSVQAFVERGVEAVVAHDIQEKETQESIPRPLWEREYDAYKSAKEQWNKIHDVPDTYKISREFAAKSHFDWNRNYTMRMKINGVDPETGDNYERWVTVQSDEELSKAEWEYYAHQAIADTPGSDPFVIEEVLEYQLYERHSAR